MIKHYKGQHIVSVSQKAIDEQLTGNRSADVFCVPEAVRWAPKNAGGKHAKKG